MLDSKHAADAKPNQGPNKMSQEEIYIANFVSNLDFQGLNGDLTKWPELGRNPNSGHFDLIPATAC